MHHAIQKAQAEIIADRKWRAREILAGNVAANKYSRWAENPVVLNLYYEYGKLLASLGDMMEAGRYFFLSGQRTAESEEAISVFVTRLSTPDPLSLYRAFPHGAKLNLREAYPEVVARELEELGLPANLYTAAKMTPRSAPEPTEKQLATWKRQARLSGAIVTVFIVLPWVIGLVVSIVMIFRWGAGFLSQLL